MDRDAFRSATLASRSTKMLLSPDEVNELRENALRSIDDSQRRGVALALLERIGNGHVLTLDEAEKLQSAIGVGDPLFHASRPIPLDSDLYVGVRDVGACKRAHANRDPSACSCNSTKCPECGSCPFVLRSVGGASGSAYMKRPSACGKCTGGDVKK
jgi:hypothetical protein